jgi:hypothetical protein
MALRLFKNTALFMLQNNVSETEFWLRIQVEPTRISDTD